MEYLNIKDFEQYNLSEKYEKMQDKERMLKRLHLLAIVLAISATFFGDVVKFLPYKIMLFIRLILIVVSIILFVWN